MGLLISFLILAAIAGSIFEGFVLCEYGTPPKDQDILEMLQAKMGEYYLDKNWDDKFQFKSRSYETPNITKTKYSLLFPYYVNDVGVVPVWYKSVKILDAMYTEMIKTSKYKITKRDKLGLNKN